MKALILAGGPGMRLRPEVSEVPKPMAEVAGRPFLEWQLEQLRDHGITDIVLSVGYGAKTIRDHFADGEAFDVSIRYVEEDERRGTGGAVRMAEPLLVDEDAFVVINGDTYLEVDFEELLAFHDEQSTVATIALSRVEKKKKGGFVDLNGTGEIHEFVEEKREGGLVNGGIRVFDPAVFEYMPDDSRFQLAEVFERLISHGEVSGYRTEGYFKDMGTPESYREINEELPEVA